MPPIARRFGLDDVALPSDHWEWVGGWVVDSEMEASADEDGWIYGSAPSEIAEIALGRKSSTNNSIHEGGMTSSASSSIQRNSVSSASFTATGSTASGGSGTNAVPPRSIEVGTESQQQQQPGTPVSGPVTTGGVIPAPSPGDKDTADTEEGNQQRRDKEGVEGGLAGEVTGRRGGGGETDTAAGAGAGVEGSADGGGDATMWLRRRRLVRLRMVGRVDGARESTSGAVALIRR